jgi:hypothetical protein
MKKVLIVLLLLVATAVAVFFILTSGQEKELVRLEESVEFLKTEAIPIRFKITSRTESSLTVMIKFYNADNEDLNSIEKTLKGKELSFDFITIKGGDRYLSFPYKVFTDEIPAIQGESLVSYYDVNGVPGIFFYDGIHEDLLHNLKALFRHVKNGTVQDLKQYFGSLVHDIEKVNSFKQGVVYRIVTHVKGGIEVMPD